MLIDKSIKNIFPCGIFSTSFFSFFLSKLLKITLYILLSAMKPKSNTRKKNWGRCGRHNADDEFCEETIAQPLVSTTQQFLHNKDVRRRNRTASVMNWWKFFENRCPHSASTMAVQRTLYATRVTYRVETAFFHGENDIVGLTPSRQTDRQTDRHTHNTCPHAQRKQLDINNKWRDSLFPPTLNGARTKIRGRERKKRHKNETKYCDLAQKRD